MTNTEKELYKIVNQKFSYELSEVRTDLNDMTIDVRHITNLAMRNTNKPFTDSEYESVCNTLISKLKQTIVDK